MALAPPILILTGYGLNCEAESSYAWELAGAKPTRMHLNDLIAAPAKLHDYAGLMFIGGFSFGDHMGSGLVFANKLRTRLREDLQQFLDAGKLVLGVCNGFQIITKLGLLPGFGKDRFAPEVALMQNDCGHFQNFWVTLAFEPASPCVFTRGLGTMPLPIRHGEGKLFAPRRTLNKLEKLGCVACRYIDPATHAPTQDFPHNPNGSARAIAGLCDPTGRVFGLMPHPEAYLFPENHPGWDLQQVRHELPDHGLGLKIFENAVAHLRGA